MQVVKILAILIGVYVVIVVVFELRIGILQPDLGNTLVITTSDADGNTRDRVITRLKSDGHIYVSAHHWPRAWFRRAVAKPEVEISMDGEKKAYRAVEVTGDEYDRVAAEYPRPLVGRILQGFAPRRILRLDPR
jgi:hypothetical protein